MQSSLGIFRAAVDALGGVRQVQLRGLQDHFVQRYRRERAAAFEAKRLVNFLNDLPKYLFEILFVVGIGLLVLATASDTGTKSALTTVALFTVAGYRLLPSFVRASAALNSARSGHRAADLVMADIRGVPRLPRLETCSRRGLHVQVADRTCRRHVRLPREPHTRCHRRDNRHPGRLVAGAGRQQRLGQEHPGRSDPGLSGSLVGRSSRRLPRPAHPGRLVAATHRLCATGRLPHRWRALGEHRLRRGLERRGPGRAAAGDRPRPARGFRRHPRRWHSRDHRGARGSPFRGSAPAHRHRACPLRPGPSTRRGHFRPRHRRRTGGSPTRSTRSTGK